VHLLVVRLNSPVPTYQNDTKAPILRFRDLFAFAYRVPASFLCLHPYIARFVPPSPCDSRSPESSYKLRASSFPESPRPFHPCYVSYPYALFDASYLSNSFAARLPRIFPTPTPTHPQTTIPMRTANLLPTNSLLAHSASIPNPTPKTIDGHAAQIYSSIVIAAYSTPKKQPYLRDLCPQVPPAGSAS